MSLFIDYQQEGNVIPARTLAVGDETEEAVVDLLNMCLGGDVCFRAALGSDASLTSGARFEAVLEVGSSEACSLDVRHVVSFTDIPPGERCRKVVRLPQGVYRIRAANIGEGSPIEVSVTASRLLVAGS